MNTKILMSAAALCLAVMGIAASFLPQEILAYTDAPANELTVLVVQAAGALYLGFAVLNWTARANLIGGIYSRPVALGNFLHFTMMAIAGWKVISDGRTLPAVLALAAVYSGFAACFGFVLFTHPRMAERRANEA